jgi:large subunit ribosomal protein L24
MRIKKGDNIIVITGKDKGKKGKVIKALPMAERVVIEGVNIKKKHMKPKKSGQKGQIVEMAAPLHVSNIAIVDPKDGKPSRIGMKIVGDKKVRISKRSGVEL